MNLRSIMKKLEHDKLITQEKKDSYYEAIKKYRVEQYKNVSVYVDEVGANLLHWAVLCNQRNDEVARLIDEEKVDVNQATIKKDYSLNYNVTPLWMAAAQGNADIVSLLLSKGADPTISPKLSIHLQTYDRHGIWKKTTPFDVAVQNENYDVVRLLEKIELDNYINNRTKEVEEYKTTVKLPFFDKVPLGFSRTEKLAAAYSLKKMMDSKDSHQLAKLKKNHPAVDNGELHDIYNGSMKARGLR